jgi:hypothetical protein
MLSNINKTLPNYTYVLCRRNTEYSYLSIYLSTYSPLLDLGRFFIFLILDTVGRTPWTGDQPFAMPLPTHRINTHTDFDTLCGIRTHSPSFQATENSSCLRPRGHCDRRRIDQPVQYTSITNSEALLQQSRQ